MGRGVLLDYPAFCDREHITIDTLSSSAIPLEHLKKMAHEAGVTFRSGDILFVRAGFTAAYDALTAERQRDLAQRASPRFHRGRIYGHGAPVAVGERLRGRSERHAQL